MGGWSGVIDVLTGGEEVLELKGEGIVGSTVWILIDATKDGDSMMLESRSETAAKIFTKWRVWLRVLEITTTKRVADGIIWWHELQNWAPLGKNKKNNIEMTEVQKNHPPQP